jgi:hypothetical protein
MIMTAGISKDLCPFAWKWTILAGILAFLKKTDPSESIQIL